MTEEQQFDEASDNLRLRRLSELIVLKRRNASLRNVVKRLTQTKEVEDRKWESGKVGKWEGSGAEEHSTLNIQHSTSNPGTGRPARHPWRRRAMSPATLAVLGVMNGHPLAAREIQAATKLDNRRVQTCLHNLERDGRVTKVAGSSPCRFLKVAAALVMLLMFCPVSRSQPAAPRPQATSAAAAVTFHSVKLEWNQSPTATAVKVRIFLGVNGVFTNSWDALRTAAPVRWFNDLPSGAQYIVGVQSGNSDWSVSSPVVTMTFTVPLNGPPVLVIPFVAEAAATPAGPWTAVHSFTVTNAWEAVRVFRLRASKP